MKNVVVFDIDGTIAKVGDRLKYLQQEKKDWDSFYEHCYEDSPIGDIIELLKVLYKDDFCIVFCTGRRESVRFMTKDWIRKHTGIMDFLLLMRPDGDFRHDTLVKPELLAAKGITPEDVLCIFEDRNSMVTRWRDLGFRCLQVCEGDF